VVVELEHGDILGLCTTIRSWFADTTATPDGRASSIATISGAKHGSSPSTTRSGNDV